MNKEGRMFQEPGLHQEFSNLSAHDSILENGKLTFRVIINWGMQTVLFAILPGDFDV